MTIRIEAAHGLPIRRNVALLSAAVAANATMLQLTSAVASISLSRVLDVQGLLGLGPAIVLAAGALAAIPAGRAMDRHGRVPVLAAGFGVGAASCGLAALGSAHDSAVVVLAGLAGVGVANGATLLARTAGGDMYPPHRRARGIALVLFGAVFGAILGPVVFGPLLAGRDLTGDALAGLWVAGGAFELVGLALVMAVRPDPKAIASALGHESAEPSRPAAPIRELLGRPGVVPAVLAARLGLGRNVSFVAATAELTERAEAWERGRLLGFNDLLSGATGAALTLLGGLALTGAGVAALAIGAAALVVVPALWILRAGSVQAGLEAAR